MSDAALASNRAPQPNPEPAPSVPDASAPAPATLSRALTVASTSETADNRPVPTAGTSAPPFSPRLLQPDPRESEATAAAVPVVEPAREEPEAAAPKPLTLSELAAVPGNVSLTAPPAVQPAPAAAPPPEPAPEGLVRGVLQQYAAAYSDLDVDAAQRVWPAVNRAALARAFDGLASQRVSLQDCRVQVAGRTAQARCSGSTTWSPKVGAGSRTESRNWTFELARAANGWQIVNARVQNR